MTEEWIKSMVAEFDRWKGLDVEIRTTSGHILYGSVSMARHAGVILDQTTDFVRVPWHSIECYWFERGKGKKELNEGDEHL